MHELVSGKYSSPLYWTKKSNNGEEENGANFLSIVFTENY
jgi:hypothetical protein